MALIKQFTEANGNTGEYWRIVKIDSDADSGKSVCIMRLYKNKEIRNSGFPMSIELNFVFNSNEIESIDPDETLPQGWRDVYYHVHYLAIKAAALSGYGKSDMEISNNERLAQILYGATDDI